MCFLKLLKDRTLGESPVPPLSHGLCLGTASVFCVSLDPKTNTLAVTGGEDDKAFVWRLSDGELLFECAGESWGGCVFLGVLAGGPVNTRQLFTSLCLVLDPETHNRRINGLVGISTGNANRPREAG